MKVLNHKREKYTNKYYNEWAYYIIMTTTSVLP